MPGTVSISRADIKSREKEWFGGSRDQFSSSLQQSRRRVSLERGTLANPTGFGNPRQSTYDEPIYRSDEPGVSLHEEHRRTAQTIKADARPEGDRAREPVVGLVLDLRGHLDQ